MLGSLFLFSLLSSSLADIVMYTYPVNPQLHPPGMFPIKKTSRGLGKVRDLPQSGIVYLKRIKPISDEFVKAADDNTFVPDLPVEPLRELSTELSAEVEDSESTSTPSTPALDELNIIPNPIISTKIEKVETIPEVKNELSLRQELAPFIISEQDDLSAESLVALDNLITAMSSTFDEGSEIVFDEPGVQEGSAKISTPSFDEGKNAVDYKKPPRHPKLVTLSGSARLHEGAYKKPYKSHHKPKLVRLPGTVSSSAHKTYSSSFSSRREGGADFDPWERVGQRLAH